MLQAVAATIFVGRQYTICSLYCPPHSKPTQQDMEELIQQLPRPFLILGDLNCRDYLWGDNTTTAPAAMIKNLMHIHDIGLLNSGEYTHYDKRFDTWSCVDLSLCSTEAQCDLNWSVKTPPPERFYESDHFPIIISRAAQNTYTPCPPRYNCKKANWPDYSRHTELQDQHIQDVDEQVTALNNTIIKAASQSIPMTKPSCSSTPNTPWWNEACKTAKRDKRRASRKFYRTRLQVDWIEYQRCKAILRRLIRQSRRSTWKTFVSSINSDTSTNEMWNKVKKIAGKYKAQNLPVIKDEQGNRQSDPKIVTELMADSFERFSNGSLYSEEFNRIRARKQAIEINFNEPNNEPYNSPFSLEELESSMQDCKNSAPGPDNINYNMIKHLHPTAIRFLLNLYNHVWETGQFPKIWHEARIIPIKKTGKTGLDTTHYRPISLTNCLCKLMERMVSNRLSWTLERIDALNPHQYGFRKKRSTINPLIKLEHDIRSAFTRKHMVLAVFFDLEKAYDTTWKRGILDQMKNIGLRGNLPTFISNLLSNRTFQVQIGNSISTTRHQIEGIPQGSVLACLLFSLAINDLKDVIPEDIKFQLYVDDLTIYIEGGYLPTMERRMQIAINKITEWASQHGFKFSTEKTKSMLFRSRGTRENPHLNLYR